MEISKLVDLNSLRTAPQLSKLQIKKLLEELQAYILDADWERFWNKNKDVFPKGFKETLK